MKSNKLLSIIQPQELINEFKTLGSANQLAKKFKISTETVYSALKIIGIDPYVKSRNTGSLFTKEQLQQDYVELQSFRKIGEKYDISTETVRQYIHKYDIAFNQRVIYDCDHTLFSCENENSFYIAGFIAADGSVKIHTRGNSYQVSMGLSIKDKSFLSMLRTIMKAETPIRDYLIRNSKRNIKWKDCWKSELTITSIQMFNDLKKFNIVPRKTLIYNFPDWLITHPLVHHFMRGYFDGDGSFYINKQRNISQIYCDIKGTEKFLTIYRSIINDICDSQGYLGKIGNIARLEYGGNGVASEIANFLYKDATIYLPRKYEIIKHLLKS